MQQLASVISMVLSLYSFLIVIRIFLSWGSIGASRFPSFYTPLTKITDPYLNIFRGLPGLQRGNLDFSPIAAMIVLSLLNNIVSMIARQGRITIGIILALITQAVGSVITFFLGLFIILFFIRVFLEYRRTSYSIQYIAILDNLLRGTIERVHRYLFSGKETSSRTLILASTAVCIVIYFALKALIAWLITYLVNLPF